MAAQPNPPNRLPQRLETSLRFSSPPKRSNPSPRRRRHVGDAAHESRGHQVRGVLRPGAADGGELPGAVRERLLRRHHLPPQHQGVHDPGRRPDGHGEGGHLDLGEEVRRRVQGVAQAQRPRGDVDGEQRAQHQREPVLHHLRQAASPQRPLHRVRQGHPWIRGARPHGEGADGARRPPPRRDQAQPRHHPRQPSRQLILSTPSSLKSLEF
uniref:Uncharacterized protein n=1 Tax=Oryza rufipogon TaxID=4529 RepID=A0A0E0PT03_ORYRU